MIPASIACISHRAAPRSGARRRTPNERPLRRNGVALTIVLLEDVIVAPLGGLDPEVRAERTVLHVLLGRLMRGVVDHRLHPA